MHSTPLAADCQARTTLSWCLVFLLSRVPRVSEQLSIHSAMASYEDVVRGMLVALDEARDLFNALGRLLADPWPADVRATLEARWAEQEEYSLQLRIYVDTHNDTLATAIASRTPALVGGPVTVHARGTVARVAEHIARATHGDLPRPPSASRNKIRGSDTRQASVG